MGLEPPPPPPLHVGHELNTGCTDPLNPNPGPSHHSTFPILVESRICLDVTNVLALCRLTRKLLRLCCLLCPVSVQ